MKIHEKFMFRCIQLAKNGLGKTYPNPLVGSVIVVDNKIIGEGWHQKSGEVHAEVHAILSVENKDLLKQATIYINLEPCSHYGKTPPCSDLIIQSGIKKVVVGSLDPNPKVAGKGIKKLIDARCEVHSGILEKECSELNKRFFTFHRKHRPFIILKWAETIDGYIAPDPKTRVGQKPVWITNSYSRQISHKLRSEEMAILVGTRTAKQDNPSLTTRDWAGKNPIRIVIDRTLKLPSTLSIFNEATETIVITEKEKTTTKNISFETIDFFRPIASQICRILYKRNIQSVIIEGGSKTIQNFINENLWDEAYVFSGDQNFQNGVVSPKFSGKLISKQKIITDKLYVYQNNK